MPSENEKQAIMRWIWEQMHRSDLKLPKDQLVFEGEHDLAYLYNTGFVDTDRYSYEKWLRAFGPHRQKNGSYRLALQDWLDKTPYRYFGPIDPPFDPMTLREGEWSLEEYKQFAKQKILPELTLTYEQFLAGLEQAKKSGQMKGDKVRIDGESKQQLADVMDQYASPKRRRALDAFRLQSERDNELPQASMGSSTPPGGARAGSGKTQKSTFRQEPDRQKQMSGQLSDLLSGGKKH